MSELHVTQLIGSACIVWAFFNIFIQDSEIKALKAKVEALEKVKK